MEATNNAVDITPQALPKVFISYKNREHQQYVTSISKMLVDDGFPLWLDKQKDVPTRRIDGLDTSLRLGLGSADVLLFFVPRQEYPPTGWLRIIDIVDSIILAFSTKHGNNPMHLFLEAQISWQSLAYGIDTRKKQTESWQEWEHRVAESFGIPVVSIKILDANESATVVGNDVLLLRAQYLTEDFALQVKPQLISRSEEKRGIEARNRLIAWLRRYKPYLILLGGLLFCYLMIAMVLESVKDAITWLPRMTWRLLRSAVRKISGK